MTFSNGNTPLDMWVNDMPTAGQGGRFYGVYIGLVTDVQDPESLGRVSVRLPWTTDPDGNPYDTWARVSTLMAGVNRGTWFIPEPNDEVLIAFEGGDPRFPIVLGGLWNGVDNPPEIMSQNNDIRSITSRSGIKVIFDDTRGGVQFTIDTPGGQHIMCQDSPASIEISDANENRIEMGSSGININAAMVLSINATTIDISASTMNVNVPMSTFSGVVKSDTNITNVTVSSTYTPGAGNIW